MVKEAAKEAVSFLKSSTLSKFVSEPLLHLLHRSLFLFCCYIVWWVNQKGSIRLAKTILN